jgi:hypothetical protein
VLSSTLWNMSRRTSQRVPREVARGSYLLLLVVMVPGEESGEWTGVV